jgi:flagellin-like hook-associated protein FlgL
MTEEELQKRIEFIIEQQARLVANQENAEGRISRLENAQIQTEMRMGDLAEAQTRMSRAQEHMNEVVAVMAEAQTHTDERLDTFIGVLERFISEGRNGKSE